MGTSKTAKMSRRDEIGAIFKRMFDAVDTDKSGALDKKEVFEFMKKVAAAMGAADEIPTDQEEIDKGLADCFGELDADGDGTISFDEVVAKFPQEMFEGLDGASEEEYAEGKKMFEGLANAFETGDFSGIAGLM